METSENGTIKNEAGPRWRGVTKGGLELQIFICLRCSPVMNSFEQYLQCY